MTHFIAIFERSPQLTARLTADVAEHDGPERVIEKARRILATFSERDLIATLDAHPRIGGDASALSDMSRAEQGTDRDPRTLSELARLNDEYERRFGFRFVVFVNGRTKSEIVPVLRQRLGNTRDVELAAGIDEFLAISLDRLRKTAARA